jgi:hypothetical protein
VEEAAGLLAKRDNLKTDEVTARARIAKTLKARDAATGK